MRAHLFAIVAAATTFSLLILGGVVHGTGSSLACPDWPTCYGEWMPEMTGGILYEHSHRMLGTLVGLLTIGLAIVLHRRRRESRALAIAGWVALALVIFQGVLGGVTVILRLPTAVSTAHLGTAMVFFCLLLWIAWRSRPGASVPAPNDGKLRLWAGIATGALYVQIILGGLVRHTGAGLACPDVPLCHGQLWPGAAAAPIAGAAHLHMTHRIVGVVVALLVIAVAVSVIRARESRASRVLSALAIGLVLVQVTLGVLSVTSLLGLFEVTAHLGVGALLLGASFLLFVSLPRAQPSLEPVSALGRAEGARA